MAHDARGRRAKQKILEARSVGGNDDQIYVPFFRRGEDGPVGLAGANLDTGLHVRLPCHLLKGLLRVLSV